MIFKYATRLYDDLNRDLTAKKLDEQQPAKMMESCILISISYLNRLRTFFKEHEPQSKEEEILFFKTVKPKFKCLLIFYQQVHNIEIRKPVGDPNMISAYLMNELKVLTHYFERHLTFYKYVRTEATYLDDQYYIRGVYNIYLDPDEGAVDGDPGFTTSHDNQLARIWANEMILVWLEKQILALAHSEKTDLKSLMEEELVVWTQTNTALTETIYGWKATKAINNGKLSIEKMARYMEKVFHVKLDNFYDTWSYICQRANKTIYLDEMKVALLEKIALKSR